MHRVFKRFSGIGVVGAFALLSIVPPALHAQAQPGAAPAKKEKKVKDQGEYDLFNGVTKETDANKRLGLLTQWKEKYPESDFKQDRLVYFLNTYQQLGKPDKMIETAKEILALDPKDINALYWITILTPQMNNTAPDALDLGEKAANGLLNAERPATTKEEDWTKAKKDFDALAHKTLGWIGMQRKNNDLAYQEFKKSLEIKPDDALVSYWMGTAIISEKKPERQMEAFWHFARAVSVEGPGALPAQTKQQLDKYLEKIYNTFHGQDPQGLAQLKQQAKASPFPPADFKIESGQEIAIRKEEEFKKTNPQLALWMSLKKELTGPQGEQYFESSMKGAAVPTLKGKVIAAKPPVRSKELQVGIADPNVPEVTLRLDAPLAGKPEIGSEIEFQGVPQAFTKDPFNVTFDVEQNKITGLKVEKPAPPARRPVAKKGAPRKKG